MKNSRDVKNGLDIKNIVLFVEFGTLIAPGILIKTILNIVSKSCFQRLKNCLMTSKNVMILMIKLVSGGMILNICGKTFLRVRGVEYV